MNHFLLTVGLSFILSIPSAFSIEVIVSYDARLPGKQTYFVIIEGEDNFVQAFGTVKVLSDKGNDYVFETNPKSPISLDAAFTDKKIHKKFKRAVRQLHRRDKPRWFNPKNWF